jgi:hypothetical protein
MIDIKHDYSSLCSTCAGVEKGLFILANWIVIEGIGTGHGSDIPGQVATSLGACDGSDEGKRR